MPVLYFLHVLYILALHTPEKTKAAGRAGEGLAREACRGVPLVTLYNIIRIIKRMKFNCITVLGLFQEESG